MRRRRSGVEKVRDLCSGPAKLCVALGIDRSFDGADLVGGERGITLVRDGLLPPREPNIGVRIGLSEGIGAARELPWRFAVPGDPNLSRVLKSPI
jgi:DNA-3-methyladenine glycosylase